MNVFAATQQEVGVRVDSEHSDIICQFLDRIDKPSRCTCGFWYRELLFQQELREYIHLKLNIHHWRQKYARHMEIFPWDKLPSGFDPSRITAVREALTRLAPCQECIRKLNPTNRRRTQLWNPERARVWKELLK